MVSYIFGNLPRHAIVRLPHPRTSDSLGQETFLTPFADKETHNYDTKCSIQYPSQSPKLTGIDQCKDKMVSILRVDIVRCYMQT